MHSDEMVDDKVRVAKERLERAANDCVVFGAREGFEIKLG
jgi:hypothetical protein